MQAAVDAAPEDAILFPRDVLREVALNYAGEEQLLTHPHAFPASGAVAGLPPTYIVNSEHDSLRSSGEAFAAQLAEAGVDVVVEMEPGSAHGHLDNPLRAQGLRSLDRMVGWIEKQAIR